MKDDPVWLCLVFGTLVWMALFAAFIDWNSLGDVCLWVGSSFCLNLAVVPLSVRIMQLGVIGVVLIALGLAMVFAGRPRHGEVVGFMRGSSNFQSAYTLVLMCLLV